MFTHQFKTDLINELQKQLPERKADITVSKISNNTFLAMYNIMVQQKWDIKTLVSDVMVKMFKVL